MSSSNRSTPTNEGPYAMGSIAPGDSPPLGPAVPFQQLLSPDSSLSSKGTEHQQQELVPEAPEPKELAKEFPVVRASTSQPDNMASVLIHASPAPSPATTPTADVLPSETAVTHNDRYDTAADTLPSLITSPSHEVVQSPDGHHPVNSQELVPLTRSIHPSSQPLLISTSSPQTSGMGVGLSSSSSSSYTVELGDTKRRTFSPSTGGMVNEKGIPVGGTFDGDLPPLGTAGLVAQEHALTARAAMNAVRRDDDERERKSSTSKSPKTPRSPKSARESTSPTGWWSRFRNRQQAQEPVDEASPGDVTPTSQRGMKSMVDLDVENLDNMLDQARAAGAELREEIKPSCFFSCVSAKWTKAQMAFCTCFVIIGTAAALLVYFLLRQAQLRAWLLEFVLNCNLRGEFTRQRLEIGGKQLEGYAAFVGLNLPDYDGVSYYPNYTSLFTEDQFARYTNRSNAHNVLDAVIFTTFIPTSERRAQWESFSGLNVTTGAFSLVTGRWALKPRQTLEQLTRPYYLAVTALDPNSTRFPPAGFDIGGYVSMEEVWLYGDKSVASELQPGGESVLTFLSKGILIAYPVYYSPTLPPRALRRNMTAGVMVSSVLTEVAMDEALKGLPDKYQVELVEPTADPLRRYLGASYEQTNLNKEYARTTRFTFAYREYQLTCTPTYDQVNEAYADDYPIYVAIATFGFFVMQLPLLALVASWGDLKKGIKRMKVLTNANRIKDLALARLSVARSETALAITSKSDFMAFLCHELRNPLHAITSMMQFLIDNGRLHIDDEEDGESVKVIRHSVSMMRSIVNDALDMTKIESGHLSFEMAPFSFREIVTQLCRVELPLAQAKGLTLTYVIGRDVPNTFYGDAARLRQVVINFISNAIKFTPAGSIHVELKVLNDIEGYRNGVVPYFPLPDGVIPPHIKPITTKRPDKATIAAAPAGSVVIDMKDAKDGKESKKSKNGSNDSKQSKESKDMKQKEEEEYDEEKLGLPKPLAWSAATSTIGMAIPTPAKKTAAGEVHPAAILAVTPPIAAVPQYSHPEVPRATPVNYPPATEAVYLELRVTDTGVGVDSDLLGRLFEPYSQGKLSIMRDHGGTGLGLALVSRIIRMMGGHVFVESKQGQGSSFVAQVSVPIAPSNVRSIAHTGEIIIDETTFKLVDSPPAAAAAAATKKDGRKNYLGLENKVDVSDSDEQGTPQSTSRTLRRRVKCGSCGHHTRPKEGKTAVVTAPSTPPTVAAIGPTSSTSPSLHVQQALARLLDITALNANTGTNSEQNEIAASSSSSTVVSLSSQPEGKTMIDDSPSISQRSFDVGTESATTTPNLSDRTMMAGGSSPGTPLSSSAEATPSGGSRSLGPSSRALVSSSSTSSNNNSVNVGSFTRNAIAAAAAMIKRRGGGRGDTVAQEARQRYGPRLFLIVDDASVNVKILLRMLITFDCVTAVNGIEAVSAVRSLYEEGIRTGGRTQFDMMLTDVLMPLMDGLQASAIVRKLEEEWDLPEIPILALTANAMSPDRLRCLDAGMSFASKPFAREDIFRVFDAAFCPGQVLRLLGDANRPPQPMMYIAPHRPPRVPKLKAITNDNAATSVTAATTNGTSNSTGNTPKITGRNVSPTTTLPPSPSPNSTTIGASPASSSSSSRNASSLSPPPSKSKRRSP